MSRFFTFLFLFYISSSERSLLTHLPISSLVGSSCLVTSSLLFGERRSALHSPPSILWFLLGFSRQHSGSSIVLSFLWLLMEFEGQHRIPFRTSSSGLRLGVPWSAPVVFNLGVQWSFPRGGAIMSEPVWVKHRFSN